MDPLQLAALTPLMARTSGRPDVVVGLLDGPVAVNHPDLPSEHIHSIPGLLPGVCAQPSSAACIHGTFVAGILGARRGSPAPALCPDCTLLLHPIFAETVRGEGLLPSATPQQLAAALVATVDAGARIINLSAALAQPFVKGEREVNEALDYAARRGVIVVVAAGNQGAVGSSAITRHPWVIPVTATDRAGRPPGYANLSGSIGRRGLSAPGAEITSLAPEGGSRTFSGTSVAAPFVTGAIALLWSEFPTASAAAVKLAVSRAATPRRNSMVPPMLDAWAAYQVMLTACARRGTP
jgi:subtilisin family serine protease